MLLSLVSLALVLRNRRQLRLFAVSTSRKSERVAWISKSFTHKDTVMLFRITVVACLLACINAFAVNSMVRNARRSSMIMGSR